MQSEKYITILSSFNNYNLPPNELIIYSIIYGFTQNGQKFTGTYEYIQQWLKRNSKKTISKALKNLIDKGLIKKVNDYRAKGKHYCEYISVINSKNNRGVKNTTLNNRGVIFRPVKSELNNTNISSSSINNNNIILDNNKTIKNNNTLTKNNNINNNNIIIKNKATLEDVYKDLDCYIPNANRMFFDKINKFSDKLPLELISFAIKETASNNVRSANYLEAILNNFVAQNIKTLEEAELAKEKRKKDIEHSKEVKNKAREIYIDKNQPNSKAIKIHKAFEDIDKYVDMFSTKKDKEAINDKKSS